MTLDEEAIRFAWAEFCQSRRSTALVELRTRFR
jgi:hypothetical protein